MKKAINYIKRHKIVTIIIIIILVAVFVVFRPKSQTVLSTQTVKRGEIIQSISGTGSIDSENSVNLNFLAGGKLAYVGARKGDQVTAGQTIAALDQRTVQKNLEGALKDYTTQRDTYDQTIANNNGQTPQTALNDNFRRILETNQNNLDKAVISVELQELAKEQSVLTTPISGVITRADAEMPGVNIAPTTTYTIADPNHLVFKVDVDEADIGKVTLNEIMKISLDAFSNETLRLPVSFIDFASHTTTTGGTAYTVQANMPDNSNFRYKIGMNGDAEIITAEKRDVLTIPLSSIFNNKYVYIKKETVYEKREIVTGLQNDTDSEIVSGLSTGDVVAMQPDEVDKQQKKGLF